MFENKYEENKQIFPTKKRKITFFFQWRIN